MKSQKNIIANPFQCQIDICENDSIMEEIYAKCFGPGRFAKAAHILRENNQCHYDISRVICDEDNKVIGGCRMWPIKFENGGEGIFLGPIAILPQFRNFGLGALLVEEVLKAHDKANNAPVFLVGDMGFFGKFGFKQVPNGFFKLPMPAMANRILWRPIGAIDCQMDAKFSGKVFS